MRRHRPRRRNGRGGRPGAPPFRYAFRPPTDVPDDTARRMCFSKRAYGDPVTATRVAAAATAERGTPLRVYACPCCGAFHLTKAPAPAGAWPEGTRVTLAVAVPAQNPEG